MGCRKTNKPRKRTKRGYAARLHYVRKRFMLVQQILIDHNYAATLEEPSTPCEESHVSESLCSSIRSNYLNIISARLTTEVKAESAINEVEILNIPDTCNGNNIQAARVVSDTNDPNAEYEMNIEWLGDDNIQYNEYVCTVEGDTCSNNKQTQSTVLDVPSNKKSKHVLARGNTEVNCILCAAKSLSRNSNALITGFAKMIRDFSGVNILKYNPSPTACSNCFKMLLKLSAFKQQIIDAEKHVQEEISQASVLEDNSQFEYIDCNKQDFNETSDTTDEDDETVGFNFVRVTDPSETTVVSDVGLNKIRLVPIENILSSKAVDLKYSPKTAEMFKCIMCEDFVTREYLKTHWCVPTVACRQGWQESESYICEDCGKQYKKFRSFKRHQISHGAKKRKCNICGETFHYVSNLRRHLRSHTGSKPYACSYCDKRFTVRWNMNQHKRMHTNSMPYKCKLCSAAFRHNVTLKKHIGRSHTANEFARTCSDEKSIEQPADSKGNYGYKQNSEDVRVAPENQSSMDNENNEQIEANCATLIHTTDNDSVRNAISGDIDTVEEIG